MISNTVAYPREVQYDAFYKEVLQDAIFRRILFTNLRTQKIVLNDSILKELRL